MACTAKTPRCRDARSYSSVLAPCCRSHLRRMMADFMELAAIHGVRWWADYGTILGMVRNPLTTAADYPWLDQSQLPEGPIPPGIIPHDKDCDLGTFAEDWRELVKVAEGLREKGYHVKIRRESASIKIRLSEINTTNIDVFTWDAAADGIMHRRSYIQVDRFKGKRFPRNWVEPTVQMAWEEMLIPAPNDPARFCEFRYGDTWLTPVEANHDGVPREW